MRERIIAALPRQELEKLVRCYPEEPAAAVARRLLGEGENGPYR